MASSRSTNYLANLTWIVLGTYIVFMPGLFFIPNAVDQYKLYGLAVFLPALAPLSRMIKTYRASPLY